MHGDFSRAVNYREGDLKMSFNGCESSPRPTQREAILRNGPAFPQPFPGFYQQTLAAVYKTFAREHWGCILHHCSTEGLFLGAFNFLAFIMGK